MKIVLFYLLLITSAPTIVFAQLKIEGKILDKKSGEPISYAHIYNTSLNSGTISNAEGFFRINVLSLRDTIFISYIGYKPLQIILEDKKTEYLVSLEENSIALNEVIVYSDQGADLYELVDNTKKSNSSQPEQAKAVYQLKSFVDDKQVEQLESYYNINIEGYRVKDLKYKAGRIAMRPFLNRIFASIETSKAILMLKLYFPNEYFPFNPTEFTKAKLKKHYKLALERKYLDENNDSIYIIQYDPTNKNGSFFEGTMWINKSKKQLLKITLNADKTPRHPFLPLFPNDTINNVSFKITQSFQSINSNMVFKHTDFYYTVDYTANFEDNRKKNYSINTEAVLYVYDYENEFTLPIFPIKNEHASDYRIISAIPYNDFFWNNCEEYKINDSKNSNERFFQDQESITNKIVITTSNLGQINSLIRTPYIQWSPARLSFPEKKNDQLHLGVTSEAYHLSIKILLDINKNKDSINIHTATIFDPLETYFHYAIDDVAKCFISTYFDLCEMKRRELEKKLLSKKYSIPSMKQIYTSFKEEFNLFKDTYFKEVNRGLNKKAMMKYNVMVKEAIGIDNIAIYHPYP